ncbi:diguanylate cyclase (GGDEF) domain-containing protein [Clostridium cavendishii DSM 21758]|uniref:Diguanylate cyclase (GGDEF) domain-containing protein n=1 Tax=Clostridium cavendishii DSM 21758 TaxID=1121302 RepID=A0A1M6SLQ8_9CLOT|nr:bifunctional diguanylate cyclase/phosphodiesterase [Clostridium cavendishii]SHK45672.1 diguanylate cyclase (GGDEF) domain-containing protein [Clostridium cavendishii DSM 21758]
MKLSKSISKSFLITMIFSIILYLILSLFLFKSFLTGEKNRAKSILINIDNFVLENTSDLSTKNSTLSKYLSLYMNTRDLKEFNAQSFFSNTQIDYMLVIDKNYNKIYQYNNPLLTNDNVLNDFDSAFDITKNLLIKNNPKLNGFVGTNDNLYFTSVEPLLSNNNLNGYIILINKFDKNLINKFNNILGKNISITNNYSSSTPYTYINGRELYIDIIPNNRTLTSLKINTLNNNSKFFIQNKELRVVYSSTKNNMILFLLFLILTCMLIIFLCYFILNKKIISRIKSINTFINNVNLKDSNFTYLPIDNSKDEISLLCEDINRMLRLIVDSQNYMERLARFDSLTDLPNRQNIFSNIDMLIKNNIPFAVFFIDIDNFKILNDTLGHNKGDDVLSELAIILKTIVTDDISIGRHGGDEFILIYKNYESIKNIEILANNILNLLSKNICIDKHSFNITFSIGASIYPNNGNDVSTLIMNSDIAMYASKHNGGNCYTLFKEDMLDDFLLEKNLLVALDKNEFILYFQPIFNINSSKIIGAEALIRWQKDGEILPPFRFLPLAKRIGIILEIDNWVLKTACEKCKEWIDDGLDICISVNTSYAQLKQPNFHKLISDILEETGLPANNLKIEITEDETIDNMNYIINVLNKIKDLGVKIALDDFGTGYSSFNYISKLPIDTIKLDRSLLVTIDKDKKSFPIVKTIVNLAHDLNLDITSEGIETKEHLNVMKNLHCENIQGYYISKPLSKDEFIDFVHSFKIPKL